MTATEFRAALLVAELSQLQAAKVLGVDARTVRRWIAGDVAIPPPVGKLVRLMSLGFLKPIQIENIQG